MLELELEAKGKHSQKKNVLSAPNPKDRKFCSYGSLVREKVKYEIMTSIRTSYGQGKTMIYITYKSGALITTLIAPKDTIPINFSC